MKISRLNELKGGDRFGSCSECGLIARTAEEEGEFRRIRFEGHTSICLCNKCYEALFTAMIEK